MEQTDFFVFIGLPLGTMQTFFSSKDRKLMRCKLPQFHPKGDLNLYPDDLNWILTISIVLHTYIHQYYLGFLNVHERLIPFWFSFGE